jgi:GDPmannose 4,6-dehydratase
MGDPIGGTGRSQTSLGRTCLVSLRALPDRARSPSTCVRHARSPAYWNGEQLRGSTLQEVPQREIAPFYPRSPYGAAKVYGYWIAVNYHEAYGAHASNRIFFNHESPICGETFVTRKITRAVARIALGLDRCLCLGSLSSERDWGHARDYVEAIRPMLQQDELDDYVIATDEQHSVREFVQRAFDELAAGVELEGEDKAEVGRVAAVAQDALLAARAACGGGNGGTEVHGFTAGDVVVRVDPCYYRPTEMQSLPDDQSKARE